LQYSHNFTVVSAREVSITRTAAKSAAYLARESFVDAVKLGDSPYRKLSPILSGFFISHPAFFCCLAHEVSPRDIVSRSEELGFLGRIWRVWVFGVTQSCLRTET
jgi:hypothetical protein